LVVAYSGMTPSRPSWVPSSRVGAAPAVSTGAPVTVTGLVARAHQEISRPELATVLSPSSQLIELTTKSAFDAALSTNITSIAPSVLLQTSDIVGKVATSFAGELGGVVPIVGQFIAAVVSLWESEQEEAARKAEQAKTACSNVYASQAPRG